MCDVATTGTCALVRTKTRRRPILPGAVIPLHLAGGESEVTDASTSGFMRLTMSNIPDNSPVFWWVAVP